MTTVLKLGGSVITEKDRPETLDGETLAALADAVADSAVADLVIVHGGGSFGHHRADRHGVTSDVGTDDAEAVVDVNAAMTTLNRFVVEALHERDVPAVPVHPFSAAHREVDGELVFPTGQVAAMLGEGFVPVVHGDVIAHPGAGATVVSGDELVALFAADVGADRVGLCSSVPGVLGVDGDVVPEITSFEQVADALGGSDATDVTGGMAAKVRELLSLSAPAYVFDADGVAPFLAGGSPGTRID
jgi:isopentenyl phosphate kinase